MKLNWSYTLLQKDKACSPVIDPAAEDSGFGALWAGSPPTKAVKVEDSVKSTDQDPWSSTQSAGDAWSAAPSTASKAEASNSDPWGGTTATNASEQQDQGASTLDPWGNAAAITLPTASSTSVQTSSKDPWDEVKAESALDRVDASGLKEEQAEKKTIAPVSNVEDNRVSNDPWASSENAVPAITSSGGGAWGDTQETKPDLFTAAHAHGEKTEAAKIDPWGEDVAVEVASRPSVNRAWGDADDYGTVSAGSQPATNDAWAATSAAGSASSYTQTSYSDRIRGGGRGRGGPGARGGGGDRFSRDTNEERGSSTFQSRSGGGSTRGSGNNQMYQAPDSGWKSRTQRHHPYSHPSNPQQNSENRYGSEQNTANFDYTLPPSQIPQSTSYEATTTTYNAHPSLFSDNREGTPAYSSSAILSSNQIDTTQIPRQTPIQAIFDMYGKEIHVSQAASTTTAHEYASVTVSTAQSSKNDKSPW